MFKSTGWAMGLVFGLILASGFVTYASEETTPVVDTQPVILTSIEDSVSTIQDKDDEPTTPTPDEPTEPKE